MTGRDRALLFGIGLALAVLASRWITVPGYMDAEYYFATGQGLASGHGFREPFLWNYLDDPGRLPHPSHSYWMPLPSWLVAAGSILLGPSFSAGRALFLLATAALPAITSQLAYALTSDRRAAWSSGLLSLAPGFYFPYLLTTDSFSPYALLGGLTLVGLASTRSWLWRWVGAGALVGFCHLTRADGILLLPLGAVAAWTSGDRPARRVFSLAAGYGAVITPWLLRNLSAFGSLLPPGQSRALWLTEYNDLFLYPAAALTPDRWLDQGWGAILGARLIALGSNLSSLWAVNGLIFLLPLMALGAWRFRSHRLVRITLAYLALVLVLMSFLFPYAGARGGYFHSSVAAMPVLWALVPSGMAAFVEWGRRRRGWDPVLGARVLGAAALLLAAAFTAYIFWNRAVGPVPDRPGWSLSDRVYARVTDRLGEYGAYGGTVAVNNPPGFHLASGRPAVVVPAGGVTALGGVVPAFDVDWVILDSNRPPGLDEVFEGSAAVPGLLPAFAWDDPEAGRIVVLRKSP